MIGGDGGNRTRVRKNRATNFYERSGSLFLLLFGRPSANFSSQPLGPESPLLCIARPYAQHSNFVAPIL